MFFKDERIDTSDAEIIWKNFKFELMPFLWRHDFQQINGKICHICSNFLQFSENYIGNIVFQWIWKLKKNNSFSPLDQEY